MDGKKALIGMSGGVDSSVAALLMLRAGYACIGATMRLYDNDMIGLEKGHTCCSLDDVEDARSVARRLGIPHYVFNFKDDFERQVIQKFVGCYERGGTPNPCIDCNRYLKFDRLLRRALELECITRKSKSPAIDTCYIRRRTKPRIRPISSPAWIRSSFPESNSPWAA